MPGERVHGNVGAARQAAAGQAAVVWFKVQQTREHRASDYGLSYTTEKVNVFKIIYILLLIPRMCGLITYYKQGDPSVS